MILESFDKQVCDFLQGLTIYLMKLLTRRLIIGGKVYERGKAMAKDIGQEPSQAETNPLFNPTLIAHMIKEMTIDIQIAFSRAIMKRFCLFICSVLHNFQ